MAKLVSVYDSDTDYEFQRRQVPIEVDSMKMVVQFNDKCADCLKFCGVKHKDIEVFTNKFNTLSKDEVAVALLVSEREVLRLLSHLVPCVGCRKSVERLFHQLQKSQHPALEPLVITTHGEISVQREFLFDPRSLFSLFQVHGSRLHTAVESIPKSKKNKRCNLHSLDTHKARTLGCWIETWDALSDSCREKVLVVDMDQLLTTVDSYLEKHKFCGECKSKVLLAYNILIGEQESSAEKNYCAALYENLRCCTKDRHIHVLNDTEFIAHLVKKAEPEFLGGKRDRHAKTLDIAQEEVLTCLGIHIFERLHRIWQKLRSEEQTWLILFYLGVDALKKSYQSALEDKQGITNLELLCEEFEEKDKRQEEKKELKRQKRRQKKAKSQPCNNSDKNFSESVIIEQVCKCSSIETSNLPKINHNMSSFHKHHSHGKNSCSDANFNSLTVSLQDCSFNHHSCCSQQHQREKSHPSEAWCDHGGDTDSCESCSMQGSNDGSEEGDGGQGSSTDIACSCECDKLRSSCHARDPKVTPHTGYSRDRISFQTNEQPSLQDLLEVICCDEDVEISEEEIQAFEARKVEVDSKRQKLRQDLRQRFQELHVANQFNPMD